MSRPFHVYRCDGCGHASFPRRLLCSSCGGEAWTRVVAADGVVEQGTTREHRTAEAKRLLVGGWSETGLVHLVSVRTSVGPVVTARSAQPLAPATAVRLLVSSGVPVAVLLGSDGRAG